MLLDSYLSSLNPGFNKPIAILSLPRECKGAQPHGLFDVFCQVWEERIALLFVQVESLKEFRLRSSPSIIMSVCATQNSGYAVVGDEGFTITMTTGWQNIVLQHQTHKHQHSTALPIPARQRFSRECWLAHCRCRLASPVLTCCLPASGGNCCVCRGALSRYARKTKNDTWPTR